MPIDPAIALGATIPPFSSSWDADDVILYHLGIGAGLGKPTDPPELASVARYQVRFTGVVFPGETVVTSMWREGDRILLSAATRERGRPLLSNAAIQVR